MSTEDPVFTVVDVNSESETKVVQGTTLTCRSINYYLHPGSCGCLQQLPCCKKARRQILYDVSGIFQSGMNAIMGPTGCGKSSLLDILADRKDRRGLEGEILINGKARDSRYKYLVGYVVQDDIVCGTLTVRENLMFSANLRLSGKLSLEEKRNIVSDVLTQLGLEKCADTKVGTEFKRGISGGERKRTNIGMELVLSPYVLFLDEPTTGLDSTTAHSVMEYLYRLSLKGRTIIFSIHQPRYAIYKLFDTLFLIAGGRCAYHGPASEVLSFFSSVGYECEEHNNPADFVLDTLQCDGRSLPNDEKDDNEDKEKLGIEIFFNEQYKSSSFFASIQSEIPETATALKNGDEYVIQSPKKSHLRDFYYVSQRTLKNVFRNPALAILQINIAVVMSILVGLIYLNLSPIENIGVRNREGVIFFLVTNQVFSQLSAIDIFLKERKLFMHENVSGYYHVSTYFLAKVLCDIIPLRTVPSFLYSLIVYFMMGFQRVADKFFRFFFCIWLTSITSASVCFFVSSSVQNFAIGNLLTAMFYVLTLIFGGYLVNIPTVLGFLRWIQYFSIFRYSTNILLINEFTGLTLCQANDTNVCTIPGINALEARGIPYETSWDLWQNYLALILLICGFLFFSFLQLLRLKKVT